MADKETQGNETPNTESPLKTFYTMVTPKKGIVNGDDMLIKIAGNYVGHCTSHTLQYQAETKERVYKPVGSADMADGLWTDKGIVKLSISGSGEGLRSYDETENGLKAILAAWHAAKPVTLEAYERESATPYLRMSAVITSVEESDPAKDDATYSFNFESAGKPESFDPSKLTQNTTPAAS